MECRMVRIFGRVQGVWYRESTRKKAEELGVSGWVRNLDDGSVEAQLHGTGEVLDAMVAWCHKGPPLANVIRVEIHPCSGGDTGTTGFVVRRG